MRDGNFSFMYVYMQINYNVCYILNYLFLAGTRALSRARSVRQHGFLVSKWCTYLIAILICSVDC